MALSLYFSNKVSLLQCFLCLLLISPASFGQTVTYSPLITATTFAAKTIDVNLAVGSLAGSAGASGGATYSIPIIMPPGTNGVAPSVSVEYNSMGGNGLLGMGWNLAGMSSITRTNRTVYHDGIANPIEMSSSDRFSLDGVRLINTAGIYGGNGTIYATETESFATITSYSHPSVVGTGWFKVVNKDGTTLEYGNTADSRMTDINQDYTHVWRLNKIQYPDGNYIEFKYESRKDFRISEINYTGNAAAGLAPYNKIQFAYKTNRIDSKTFSDYGGTAQTGPTILDDYLLDKITVLAEGQTVKSYQFNYGNDNINSYLNEIVESGSDGSSLNSTLFKYGDKPTDFETANSSIVAGQSVDLFNGDFDGDGYSDILASTYTIVNSVPNHSDFKIYKRTATSASYSVAATGLLTSNFTLVGDKNSPNGYNFLARDYSGDGVDDLLTIKTSPTTPNRTLDLIRLYQFSNGATTPAFSDLPIDPTYTKIHASNNFLYTGDFNGDGVEDVLTMLSTTGSVFESHLYFGNQSTSFGLVGLTGTTYFTINDWPAADQIHVLDFNGDGKSDLMLIKDSNCEILTFDNNTARRIYFSTTFPTKDHLLYFGDFNGDHKTDILARASQTNNAAAWSKAISTGKSFIVSPFPFSHTPTITGISSDDPVTIADFNGDGKTDIFHGWNYFVGGSANTSRLDVYYSQGDGFYYQQNTFSSMLGFGPQTVFDLNGDGRSDLVNLTNYQNPFNIFYFRKDGKENLLEKVANGVNHVTEWNYKKLNDAGSFYTRTGITPAPLNTVQLSLYAVSDFKGQNGSGGISTTQYSYTDAKVNRSGKGFLGFASITEDNQTTGTKTISTHEFSPTFLTEAPYQTSTYLSATNELLNQTTMTNEWVDLSLGTGNRRNWYRVMGSSTNNAFEGRTTSTTNQYDSYGNLTQITINNNNVETTTTTAQYGTFATPVPAKPTTSTTTKARAGQPPYPVTTTFDYSPTTGLLTSKTDFSGLAQPVTTTYGYNSLGNPISTIATPAGMTARTTSTTFDTKGRYAISSTNVLGQTSSATYDSIWGKPLSTLGIDGISTTYQYDAWGRTLQTTMQANQSQPYTITQSWGWDLNNVPNSVYYNVVQHPGRPDVKTWLDALGREVKKQTEGFNSQWITQLQTYDTRGNVATATQPYLPSESQLITTTTYDAYNRVSTINNPAVGTTSLGYNYAVGNLTMTTTNPAGQVSSKVTDASGHTISATDNGGTLMYSYNSQGNVLAVVQGANTPTVSEYDDYGQQTKLIDQNAGTTTYEYNAAGELIKQTNANGGVHTMVNDVMGRLITRSGPEGTTTNEYYPVGDASVNQIKKITGFTSGNFTEYTYDSNGRLSTSQETVDGTAYTTAYTYNAYGDVTQKTYPSGFYTNHAYDGNGFATAITNSSNFALFTAVTQNGLGQPLLYNLGNGKTSTNTYSIHGLPIHYSTPGVQDLNLTWTYANGNLTKRQDAIKTREESFTYDNLNRLTGSTVLGLTGQTIAYSPNGNISSKTDAGSYSYLASKPNAVSAVTNPTNVIPALQQLVSYTAFMQPQTLTENNYGLTYTYGADYERIKGVLTQNSTLIRTRYYAGAGYEKDISSTSTKELHYIDSPAGLIAIMVREGGVDTYHYVYTDHLGSILSVTDAGGTVEAEQNFDAWGRRRNPTTWAYTAITSPPDWLYRGYTSHEHLDPFVLINMNGRIYDPVVGRVLSPDNFVPDPFSTQGFNRYAYGFNNPLKYTDPDGQFIHIIVGAVVGGLINGLIHIDRPGGFWKGAVIGAAAGALIAATGGAAAVAASTGSFAGAFSAAAVSTATSGAIGGAIAATAGTAIGSPVLGLGNKAVFGDPYSLKQYGKDVLLAGITGGVAGGVSSALGGKNFWTGKATPGTSTFTMPERAFSRWQDSRVGKVSVGNGTGTFDDFIDDRGNLIPKHSFEANFSNQGGEFLDDGARIVEQTFAEKNIIPLGRSANHIFSSKPGKLIDTPGNRNLLSDLINNRNNFIGVDSYGKGWYSRLLDNGNTIFGYTKNGILKGAGISQTSEDITRGLILRK